MQAAVVSLLEENEMNYKISYYYWAAFIPHGFAGVKLDDALLIQMHRRLEGLYRQACDQSGNTKDNDSLEKTMMTLARDVYRRLEDREKTLSQVV